jgi:peptidase C25-like protein
LPLNRTSTPGRAVVAALSVLLLVPSGARAAGATGAAGAKSGAAAAPAARPARSSAPAPAFRITLNEEGVYRVAYEDLKGAGLQARSLASRRLGLTNRGESVPLWVEDGGDGQLGPGDWVEFVGERLPGETAHFNEYTNVNVYVLRTDVAKPLRMRAAVAPGAVSAAKAAPLTTRVHLEQDLLLLRLAGRTAKREELWYWTKLTHIDPQPFRHFLNLADLDPTSSRPVAIRLEFRGWSQPAMKHVADLKDHQVEISVGGRVVGRDEWNNTDGTRLIELPALPAASLKPGPVELTVRVPPRTDKPGADPMVDVVVLNWIEIEYPRVGRLQAPQTRLYADEGGPLRLLSTSGEPVAVYGDDGSRGAGRGLRVEPGARDVKVVWANPGKARRLDIVVGKQFLRPGAVVLDAPSHLASKNHQADYIMVAHERLKGAIEPLAQFYRNRGMSVDVVDIQDVYDEFNDGILHPRALKDFLSYAYHSWKRPAPRWVLLVGDASWDAKNEKHDEEQYPAAAFSPSHGTTFAEIDAAHYMPGTELKHRNLIPTWSYLTYDGHAAGDNWFVSVDGEDDLPDMAVGRFPVTEPSDVTAIVEKTIRYQQQPEYGPWRNRMLWITSEQPGFIQMSDQLAEVFGKEGFAAEKVYPPPDAAAGAHDQQRLREALNRGDLLVHFVGHGGRYIWRTGPPDWQKHRDLFNLDDIDKLNASDRLPVIVSMTCYSAPFDHPSADSIGEKFLRVKGKGAVAVIAASWRNAPYRTMSEDVYRELTEGGQTLGEGIQKVKRKNVHREFVEQYNLLGDPALVMATPRLKIDVQANTAADGPPTVRAHVKADHFAGRAIVEWLDAKGELADRQELDVDGPGFTATLAPAPGWQSPTAASVRVYAWDADARVDAAGVASLSSASASLPAGKVTP